MNLAAIFTGWQSDPRMRELDNANAKLKAAFDALTSSGRFSGDEGQNVQGVAEAIAAPITSETISYRLDEP